MITRARVDLFGYSIAALTLLVACGSSSQSGIDSGVPVQDVGTIPDAAPPRDGGPTSCEEFGHFGVPTDTFVLPAQMDGTRQVINYPDIQASFPHVAWATVERLYLPAGSYKSLLIGNLPVRDPAHPLVITNQGGQVRIENNPMGNYIWSMSEGAGWVLTGRYDPMSQTGDVGFQGHRCGRYANSQDTYGILSDDGFALMAPYLHMGIAVQHATKFEIEYVEVRRSGFAGIRLINPRTTGDPAVPMEDVRVHDVYIHDTAGEGVYFGWTLAPPANAFPGLQIYNTRMLRTGNEALQIQDLADGTHVYNNVFASSGLHWLDNGLGRYQDNGAQIQTRSGSIEIDHNLILDGAGTIVSFWSQPETGDGDRHVRVHDNLFADTLDVGFYFGGTSTAGSTFEFRNNYFRGLIYGYQIITPMDSAPTTVFGFDSNLMAPVTLTGNTWEGSQLIANGIHGGAGSSGIVTATANTNTTVAPVSFVNAGYPADNPGHHLTAWAPQATVAMGSPMVTYHVGDVVAYGMTRDLYQCIMMTTAGPPPMHPEAWMRLPVPVDDMRIAAGSPYAGMGIF